MNLINRVLMAAGAGAASYHELSRKHELVFNACSDANTALKSAARKMYSKVAKLAQLLFSLTKRLADGYCWLRGRPRDNAHFSTAWQNGTLCKLIYMNLRTTVLLEEETGTESDYRIRSRFFPPPDEPLIRHDA